MRLAEAPAHYVTGEESALVHWLDGGEAKPTKVPPRPFERGVAGRPTLVDNVETLAHLALITRFGSTWWRSIGTGEDPGSCLTTVTGASRRPAVFEVPYGLPLLTLLEHAEVQPGQGVLIGGYFGTWLSPEAARSVTLTRGGLAAAGASLGCGAIVALPADVCPLMELARVTRWLAGESAGQCGPCAFGLPAIAGAVEDLAAGGRPRESLARARSMAADGRQAGRLQAAGRCGPLRVQRAAGLRRPRGRAPAPRLQRRGRRGGPARARTPGAVAMTFRLVLDPIACDGHGICAELFPEGIRLDDWGYPILVAGDVPPAWRAHARRAATACPKLALTIDRGDQRWRRVERAIRPAQSPQAAEAERTAQ